MARKIIRLTESELISYIKRAINEAPTGLEPVLVRADGFTIPFEEGGYGNEFSQQQIKDWIEKVQIGMQGNMSALSYFIDNHSLGMELPPIVQYTVGTSSTGSSTLNDRLAGKRENFIKNIIRKGFEAAVNAEGAKLDFEQIRKYITNAKGNYYNTGLSKAFSRLTSKPIPSERESSVMIVVYEIKGLTRDRISHLRQGMEKDASGSYISGLADWLGMKETNPKGIVDKLRKLETISDIQDLHDDLGNQGGLENWLNKSLQKGGDESYWKQKAVEALNTLARKNGKSEIAQYKFGNIIFNAGVLI